MTTYILYNTYILYIICVNVKTIVLLKKIFHNFFPIKFYVIYTKSNISHIIQNKTAGNRNSQIQNMIYM